MHWVIEDKISKNKPKLNRNKRCPSSLFISKWTSVWMLLGAYTKTASPTGWFDSFYTLKCAYLCIFRRTVHIQKYNTDIIPPMEMCRAYPRKQRPAYEYERAAVFGVGAMTLRRLCSAVPIHANLFLRAMIEYPKKSHKNVKKWSERLSFSSVCQPPTWYSA